MDVLYVRRSFRIGSLEKFLNGPMRIQDEWNRSRIKGSIVLKRYVDYHQDKTKEDKMQRFGIESVFDTVTKTSYTKELEAYSVGDKERNAKKH